MRFRVWGCRGSLAAPGRDTLRYGGNTSCVEVRLDDGTLLVLDAGTGIRPLGVSLGEDVPETIHVFLSHLHLDHLQGLAFFAPLWRDDVDLHIWGPPSPTRTLERRVARYLSPPLFPVPLQEIPSAPAFHDARGNLGIGEALITARPVSHQGPTVGYRIEEGGRSLAYIPDHEPALGIPLAQAEPAWISGHFVAHGVDVLLHDAQYSDEEYPRHIGWGHSSISDVVTFASIAEVEQLVLFHHDPYNSDEDLDRLLEIARGMWTGPTPPILAAEGMEMELLPRAESASA